MHIRKHCAKRGILYNYECWLYWRKVFYEKLWWRADEYKIHCENMPIKQDTEENFIKAMRRAFAAKKARDAVAAKLHELTNKQYRLKNTYLILWDVY